MDCRFSQVVTFLLCFVLAMWTQPAYASGEKLEIESLTGMHTTFVVVDFTTDEPLTANGVTKDWIRTYLEMRLRQLGLEVIPNFSDKDHDKNKLGNESTTELAVSVNSVPDKTKSFMACALDVQLLQNARLARNEAFCPLLATWQRNYTGLWSYTLVKQNVRQTLEDDMDAFANDFLKANPPKNIQK